MTFLNPAYLIGLIAAGIPIIIHFLNLRRMKEVEFSSIKFLKEIQRTKIRNIKIKQWLLLLIRVLILIFIVLAFARPTIKDKFFISAGSDGKTSAVIIIDNSISMAAKKNSMTNLELSKITAKNYLSLLNADDEISIISTSLDTKKLKLKNISEAQKQVENINVSYVSVDLISSLKLAVDVLKESTNLNKEIFICSDFQKSLTLSKLNEYFDKNTDERIKIFINNLSIDNLRNISVIDLNLENQILQKGKKINFTGKLSNSSQSESSENVISIFINNERVGQTGFFIAPKEKINLNLETDLKSSGLIESFAEIDDDEINYDNRYYNSFFIPEKINVIGISDNPNELDYISRVINNVENMELKIIPIDRIASVDYSSISVAFVVIPNEQKRVVELVEQLPKNLNIIILPGINTDEATMNLFLKKMNLGSAKFIQTNTPIEFDKIDYNHPIFKDLFESKNFPKIESPKILKEFRLNISKPFNEIITLQNKSAFFIEKILENKRLLIFSQTFDDKFGDFQFKGIFAPMLVKAIYYLSVDYSKNKPTFPGESINFDLNRITSKTIEVIKPEGEKEYLPIINEKRFSYSNTNQIGTYKFYNDGKLIHYESVNINSMEYIYSFYTSSEISEKLKSKGFTNKIFFVDKNENIKNIVSHSRVGTELWKVIILFVLLLLLIEMFLARNTKSEIAKVNR